MENEQVLLKVQKLLKLAEKAGTPEEAATAMAKASELLAKHDLGLDDLSGLSPNSPNEENFGKPSQEFVQSTSRVMRWKARMLTTIAREHCCKSWIMPKQGIVLLGHEKNRQTVKYLWNSICNQIDDFTKRNAYGCGGDYVNAYRCGMVETISVRLKGSTQKAVQETYQENAGNSMALVRIDRAIDLMKKLANEVQHETPGLRNLPGRAVNSFGFNHGKRDGHKVAISNAKDGLGSGQKKLK